MPLGPKRDFEIDHGASDDFVTGAAFQVAATVHHIREMNRSREHK